MVSKRCLMVLGPAVLSLTLWSAEAAQASAAQPSLTRPVVAAGTVTTGQTPLLPGDEKDEQDYNRGYFSGHKAGRDSCLTGLQKSAEMPSVAGVSEYYKNGVSEGYAAGRATCESTGTTDEDTSTDEGTPSDESGNTEDTDYGLSGSQKSIKGSEKIGKSSEKIGEVPSHTDISQMRR